MVHMILLLVDLLLQEYSLKLSFDNEEYQLDFLSVILSFKNNIVFLGIKL